MDKLAYQRQYYAIHSEEIKESGKRYRRKQRRGEIEPEKSPEERQKDIAEWLEYMDKKY